MKHLLNTTWRIAIAALVMLAVLAWIGVMFFLHARSLMEQQLKTNLKNTALSAAMQFDGRTIEMIRDAEDVDSPVFKDVSQRLRLLRDEVPGLRFAYILRRTDAPGMLEFVADADTLLDDASLDRNGNGEVEPDEEPSYPGDLYDIGDVPALQTDAFLRATTDEEFTVDQWGELISGYAPIRRGDNGKIVAVLGLDMTAEDFIAASQSIFSPVVFVLAVAGLIFIGAAAAVSILRTRIGFYQKLSEERSGLLQLTFHQLGEPLTIFKWSLETLKDRDPKMKLDTLVDEHIANMEQGVERMEHVVDILREAEQVEHGSLPYHPTKSSFSELLQEITKHEQPLLKRRNQTLEVECENKLWCTMDPVWIAQVLRTLIHNAMHFSKDGAAITVKAAYKRNAVQVQVIDRGIGIPKNDMPKLFKKFVRGSNALTQHPYGTGLSLYTAKGILDQAGGTINIKSEEGKGTVVTFTLPAA